MATSSFVVKHLAGWLRDVPISIQPTIAGCNDDAFGPVSTCRFFDFTLTFQNVILLIASAVFIPLAALQIAVLIRRPSVTGKSPPARHRWLSIFVHQNPLDRAGAARVILANLHMLLCAVTLGLLVDDASLQRVMSARTAVASVALNFVASVLLIPATVVCRRKLANGSPILPLYLFITVLTDACRLRTLAGVAAIEHTAFYRASVADIIIKGLALFAENTTGLASVHAAPDAKASFLSRMLFWWLKDVLWTGFRRPLDMVNLGGSLGTEYDSELLGKSLQQAWVVTLRTHVNKAIAKGGKAHSDDTIELDEFRSDDARSKGDNGGVSRQAVEEAASQSRTLLLKACFYAFPQAVLAPVIPALIRVGVQLCLPFLVSRTLAFASSQQDPSNAQPSAYGWGLVGAYAMAYLVEAFSSGQFYWLADKTQILLRGALIDVIYRKSLRLHLSTASEVGGGSISNLMSVDLERVCRAIVPLHTIWSGLLQVGLSAYLLYLQLGLTFIATLVSIGLCLALPPIIARGIGPRQAAWSGATDKRVNLVSSAVNNAKGVKYMAYERFIAEKLHEARSEELQLGWRYFRRLLTISTITNLVKEFTALTTFTTLLLVDHYTGSERFNVSNVVTSLTLLNLLETPLLQIGQQYGAVVAALVSLRRIQAFLGKRERPLVGVNAVDNTPSVDHSGRGIRVASTSSFEDSTIAASFKSASLGWSPNGKPVLVNVTLDIPANALTMICGPIGSGKSTLLQSILGEVDVQSGTIRLPMLREPVAYVAQDGWLQENATIRDNITLQTPFDAELYQMAIYAAALHIDLKQLDKHDDTPAKSLSGGQRQRLALARALYSQADAYVMDDFTSALDAETAAHVWNALMGPAGLLRNKTVIFATNALQFLGSATLIVRLQNGKVVEQGGPQELSAAARDAISRASIDEAERARAEARKAAKATESADRKDAQHETVEHGTIRWSIYKQWCLAAGVLMCVVVFLGGAALLVAAKTGWVVYLQYFARAQETIQGNLDKWKWLGGLAGLVAFTMILFPSLFFPQCWVCVVKVGGKLHKSQVQGVWNAGMSFFESHAPGVIINRFSQDIFVMDWELTLALTNFLGCAFELVAQMLLMVIPVPYLLIVVAIVGVAYVGIQRLYAPVSRQLRRLEMATKSPLYSQFAETSQPSGLATIRALRRQQTFVDVNTGRLDRSQQPYFYLQAVRRWLLTSLNLLSLIVNVSLVAIIVILKNTKQISLLGAGLVNATQLSLMLNLTLISYTELEITSIALERILAFAALDPEEPAGVTRKALTPSGVKGKLELRNLSVTYPEAPKPALRGVSLTAKPGERIGICGRSGSGKSTLLLAIFRMLEPTEGEIRLDDQDIQAVSAFSLRNSLTIVPQNALVLSASVRENLDPLREHDDSAIWNALETCRLMDVIRAFPNGLDTELDAKFNLSAGQRQLFNLTRALLRERKLLVLDEATSSMDQETDAAIQDVLRTQFRDTTILTVAHRIATVRDYDRIMVLSNGEVIELDTPDNLMQTENSVFRALAIEQGVQ